MAQTSRDSLSQAEKLLRSGYKEEARGLIVGYLKDNPHSVKAWWLMSYSVDDEAQKIECLQEVLARAPEHAKAQKRLAALTGETNPRSTNGNMIEKFSAGWQNLKLPLPAVTIIVVLFLGLLTLGYFGYKIFVLPPLPELATIGVAHNPVLLLPTPSPAGNPAVSATLVVSSTPTLDSNVTRTPIPEDQIGTEIGQYPPDFTLINALTNAEVNMRDFAGQPVILVFLNTLNPASDEEMSGLQAVYEKYQADGLVVLGVGVGSSQAALRNYTGRFGGLTFPLMSDWEHEIAKQYQINIIPTTIFIRKNGKIWQVSSGVLNEAELEGVASSILKVP